MLYQLSDISCVALGFHQGMVGLGAGLCQI